MKTHLILFLILIIFASQAVAQDEFGIELFKEIEVTGDYNDVAIYRDHIIGANRYGLSILDYNRENEPNPTTVINHYPTLNGASRLAVRDSLCFVVGNEREPGLYIYNITDLSDIYQIGFFPNRNHYRNRLLNVMCYLNYAYISSQDSLLIIDVSDPLQPVQCGGIAPRIGAVKFINETLFAAGSLPDERDQVYLISFDVSDPENPELLSSVGFSRVDPVRVFTVGEDFAYVHATLPEYEDENRYRDSLYVVDISDPEDMQIVWGVSRHVILGDASIVRGNYIIGAGSGIYIFSIWERERPVELSNRGLPFGGKAGSSVALSGDLVFSPRQEYGLNVTDISDPRNPVSLPTGMNWGEFNSLAKQDDYIFVADPTKGVEEQYRECGRLRIYSVADIYNPVEIAVLDSIGRCDEIIILDTLALLGSKYLRYDGNWVDQGLFILSISNPQNPERICYIQTSSIEKMVLGGGMLFYLSRNTFHVISLEDIYNPQDNVLFTEHSPNDYAISGDYLYIAGSRDLNGLSIWDFHDLGNIEQIGGVIIDNFYDKYLGLNGNYAYLNGESRLAIVYVEDPENPEVVFLSEEEDEDIYNGDNGLEIIGNILFLCGEDGILKMFSLEDPERPELIGRCITPAGNSNITADLEAGYAYIGGGYDLSIYDISRALWDWDVNVSSDAHNFGRVSTDASSVWEFTITNAADQTVEIEDITIDSLGFAVEFDEAFDLEPDAETTFAVTFDPAEERTYEALLWVHTARRDVRIELKGTGAPVGVPDEENLLPQELTLNAPYPNPFNSSIAITYTLPTPAHVTLTVFDQSGREITTLIDAPAQPGMHRCIWQDAQIPGGVYFLELNAGGRKEARKVVYLR